MAAPTAPPAPAATSGPSSGGSAGAISEAASAHGQTARVPCPQCGEKVRGGLVRCWNCGAFMRPDVAARYAQMDQSAREEVPFQPLEEIDAPADARRPAAPAPRRTWAAAGDGEGDFELSGDFSAAPAAAAGEYTMDEFQMEGGLAGKFTAGQAPAGQPPAGQAPAGQAPAAKAAPARPSAEAPPAAEPPAAPPPETAAEPTDGADETPARTPPPEGPDGDVSHSEATAGDALLNIALEDQRARKSGLRITGSAILLHCPAGHPVKVKRKFAGKVGRCPHPGCGLRFVVPEVAPGPTGDAPGDASDIAGDAAAGPAAAPDPLAVGPFTRWIDDVRVHTVAPDKVKRKAESQAKTFTPADLALSPEALLVLILKGKAGPFGIGGEKPAAVRAKARTHLGAAAPDLENLPLEHVALSGENLGELTVEYPPLVEAESTFGDCAVFGAGRVVVRVPPSGGEQEGEVQFLSMTLSQFRRLSAGLAEFGFVTDFGKASPVPLTDEAPVHTGHYTDAEVPELPRPDLYLADPDLNAVIAGYRCDGCGLVVSEDGRKKEKLGGANGKGLAKAKCPKCGEKFGSNPLYKLATA